MKVAYFTHYLYNIKSGPGRFSEQLKAFSSRRIQFNFFSDSIDSIHLNEVKVSLIPLFQLLPGYWLIRSLLFYRAFRKSSFGFDLVICSNAFEGFFLTLFIKKIPVLVMVNDDNYTFTKHNFKVVRKLYPLRKSLSRYFGFYIERMVCQRASGVIACSNYIKNTVATFYKIELSKIQVMYPGVDLEYFIPKRSDRRYFEGGKIKVLFAKNDWKRGGLDVIIRGLSEVSKKSICFQIAGVSAQEKGQILALAKQSDFQNKISVEGIQSRHQMVDKFSNADVLVLCSRQEAFGILLLEAMATGTPIIATNVGGIPEVLADGRAGFLISPDSSNDLTSLLNTLIENPKLIDSKVKYALNHVKNFSTNILYSKLESYILSFERKKE